MPRVADEGTSSELTPAGVRGRARVGIRTWPVGGAQWGAAGAWPQLGFSIPARVRTWAAVEIGAGRLFPGLRSPSAPASFCTLRRIASPPCRRRRLWPPSPRPPWAAVLGLARTIPTSRSRWLRSNALQHHHQQLRLDRWYRCRVGIRRQLVSGASRIRLYWAAKPKRNGCRCVCSWGCCLQR
jgi:hypothetical protein